MPRKNKKSYTYYLEAYGVVSMLILMKSYERQEEYMECYFIKKAIENKNKRLNFDLPSNPNTDLWEYLVDGDESEKKQLLAAQIIIDAKNYSDLIQSGEL